MMCVYMANHSDRFIPYVGSLREIAKLIYHKYANALHAINSPRAWTGLSKMETPPVEQPFGMRLTLVYVCL